MCVAALAWRAHPDWPLLAIGNRDEYHDRPAAPLAQWADGSGILAGQDLRSGGTWLGVAPAGRFVLVTNRRGFGDPDPACASRGRLVTGLLTGAENPSTVKLRDFNPFNLILVERTEARFLSNRPDETRATLAHGLYGLSNGALDEPWPKTLKLKAALLDWLNRDGPDLGELFTDLANEDLPDIGLHPTQPSDVRREAPDTPPFIRDPVYGTRCSTVLAVAATGDATIRERRFDAAGNLAGETRIDFRWPV